MSITFSVSLIYRCVVIGFNYLKQRIWWSLLLKTGENGHPNLVCRSMKKKKKGSYWLEYENLDKTTKAQNDLTDYKGNDSCRLKAWLSRFQYQWQQPYHCSVTKKIGGNTTRRRNTSFILDTETMTFYRELHSLWQSLQSDDLTGLKSVRGYTMVSEAQTLIFQSISVQDYRKLSDSKENRTRIPG